MDRLIELYQKTGGGHKLLSDADFGEYSRLRKEEYQNRRTELLDMGMLNIRACKDDNGDIIGFSWSKPPIPNPHIV